MKSTSWHEIGLAALAGLMVCSSLAAAGGSDNSVTVVRNHVQNTSNDGLSTYVKFNGKVILVDTGGEARSLLQKLVDMKLDASLIETVVISRNRSDHLGGLSDLLSASAKQPKVYVPAPVPEKMMRQNSRAEVVAVSKPMGIQPDAWLVGPMELESKEGSMTEQVLVLNQDDGLVVIVGCSHPDIVSVVEHVKEVFGYRKIKLIVGAIHLRKTPKKEIKEISLRLQQMGVENLALSNCTGKPALKIFRQEWGDRMVSFDPGNTIDF